MVGEEETCELDSLADCVFFVGDLASGQAQPMVVSAYLHWLVYPLLRTLL